MRQGLHPLLDVIDSFSCAYPLLACASCQSRKYSPCFLTRLCWWLVRPLCWLAYSWVIILNVREWPSLTKYKAEIRLRSVGILYRLSASASTIISIFFILHPYIVAWSEEQQLPCCYRSCSFVRKHCIASPIWNLHSTKLCVRTTVGPRYLSLPWCLRELDLGCHIDSCAKISSAMSI